MNLGSERKCVCASEKRRASHLFTARPAPEVGRAFGHMGACGSKPEQWPVEDGTDVAPPLPKPQEAGDATPSRKSVASRTVCETLDGLELELADMTAQSDAVGKTIAGLSPDMPAPVGARSELAKLHGAANKLLTTRIDAIVTGDLQSGREEARAHRKALVLASEALIETVEAQIRAIDTRNAGAAENQPAAEDAAPPPP